MASKPNTPKGTRDFSQLEMQRRNYIFDTIREVFRLFGYRQIETPAMETLGTLMGKYGEEGDKLLFKILNSGDFLSGMVREELVGEEPLRVAARICDKGLRYDLTVPFARYVVQHRDEIKLPFKRYQIQPVWRADRPQKGRYREFYQCDADVVGSDSLLNEVELLQMVDMVFRRLNVRVVIKLNNRKILAGIAELIGRPDKLVDITVAIDKIEKIGIEKVKEELCERGLEAEAVERLVPVLSIGGTAAERLEQLDGILAESETGRAGVEELRTVIAATERLGLEAALELDVSLARGLNYYTGTIIEVKAVDTPIGSICGGGRYDNLTGIFGLPGISGVGISFGADRIYDVLTALDLFPAQAMQSICVVFANFGSSEAALSMDVMKKLRADGISAEIYPEEAKMKKQIGYADNIGARYFAMIGQSEAEQGVVAIKNLADGSQTTVPFADLAAALA